MASRQDIESARLIMMKARTALDTHEMLKGVTPSSEHTRLTRAFTETTKTYLKLSATQR
jgi:hypothetical protein